MSDDLDESATLTAPTQEASPCTTRTPPPRPVLGLDYYVENGRWVFTEVWHQKRGYCCMNNCRHCPWGYTAPKLPESLQPPKPRRLVRVKARRA